MSKPKIVYRDAITGRFVTRAFAEANPSTTVRHEYREKPCEEWR
jgi:hypothetical protein